MSKAPHYVTMSEAVLGVSGTCIAATSSTRCTTSALDSCKKLQLATVLKSAAAQLAPAYFHADALFLAGLCLCIVQLLQRALNTSFNLVR
jgi:hypothetical protein